MFRFRAPVIGAAAALLVCLGGAALLWVLSSDADDTRDRAVTRAGEVDVVADGPTSVDRETPARIEHQQAVPRPPFVAPLPTQTPTAPKRSEQVAVPQPKPETTPTPAPQPVSEPQVPPAPLDAVLVETPAPELLENLDAFLMMTRLGVELADVETLTDPTVNDDAVFFAHLDLYSAQWEDE